MADLRENVKRMMAAGVPEEEIGGYIRQYGGNDSPPVASPPQEPSAQQSPSDGNGILRGLGLGARGVIQGVGSLADLAAAPVRAGLNYANEKLGGDPEYFKPASPALADSMGLPAPETPRERVIQGGIEGAAAAVPTMGAGLALQGFGRLPAAARWLLEKPGMQVAGGLTGGAAASSAEEKGAGPVGQFAAGIAGGMAPVAAGIGGNISRVAHGVRTGLDAFTPAGRERIAGQTIRRFSRNPDELASRLEGGSTEFVPGSLPTAAQASGDSGLAVLEKGLASTQPHGSAFADRYAAQGAARNEAIERGLSSSAPYGGTLDANSAGTRIRTAFDSNYGAARQRTRDAYENIDPDNTAWFDLRPLVDSFDELMSGSRYEQVPSGISSILGQMRKDIGEGLNVNYRDLQAVRTVLSDMGQSAAVSGDRATGRLAGGMKQRLDDYLESLSADPDLIGSAPAPKPGSRAYRDATREARSAVGADPYYDDLEYLMQEGLNYDSVERAIGKSGIADLNKAAPGLVRRNGRLQPDVVAGDMAGGTAYGYGGADTPNSGDALLEMLVNRLGPGGMRRRAAEIKMRDDILSAANSEQAHTGFLPSQARRFQEAKQVRTEQGRRFESGANRPMTRRGNSLEGEQVPTVSVPANYFRPGENGGEAMRAFQKSVGNSADAQAAMRDYVVAQARAAAIKPDGTIDFNRLSAWNRRHGPALRELEMENLSAMPGVRADISRARTADLLAGTRGSPTAQNLSTQAIMERITGDSRIGANTGAVDSLGNSILSALVSGPSRVAGDFLFGAPNEAIRELLTNAMLDPRMAARLLQSARSLPEQRIADMLRGYGRAAGSIGARQGLLEMFN